MNQNLIEIVLLWYISIFQVERKAEIIQEDLIEVEKKYTKKLQDLENEKVAKNNPIISI